jgi:hypothetical protein
MVFRLNPSQLQKMFYIHAVLYTVYALRECKSVRKMRQEIVMNYFLL